MNGARHVATGVTRVRVCLRKLQPLSLTAAAFLNNQLSTVTIELKSFEQGFT